MKKLFLISGILFLLVGGELLAVDKFVLNMAANVDADGFTWGGILGRSPLSQPKVFDPPEALAYMVISTGFITLMYSFIARRKKAEG